MPAVLNPNKLLLALLVIALAVLYAGNSGGLRFGGGEEDEGSGFGGTGRIPTAESGPGGTGYQPWLGDSGEVQVRPEPEAAPIAEQIADDDIARLPAIAEVQPPAAVVTAPELAAAHTAEVSITDSIQTRLRRDAVIYQRIVESVEGYYPPEIDHAITRTATAEPEPEPEPRLAPAIAAVSPAALPAAPAPSRESSPAASAGEVAEPAPGSSAPNWADLVAYLVENQPDTPLEEAEAGTETPATQRPDRIRRPDLPPVQRGRIIQRPPVLPPRIQPLGL